MKNAIQLNNVVTLRESFEIVKKSNSEYLKRVFAEQLMKLNAEEFYHFMFGLK